MTEKEAYELIEREEAAASFMEDRYNALCAAHDNYCDGKGEQFTTRDEILRELHEAREVWDGISTDLIRAQENFGEEVFKKARQDFQKAMRKKWEEQGGEKVWCEGCKEFHPAGAVRTRR
jgi:hypothetical protein